MNTATRAVHSECKFLMEAVFRGDCFRGILSHFFALFALLLLVPSFSLAQQAHPTESQVKSAYLYNFGKFVKWPGDRMNISDTVQICLLGQDPFGTTLDSTVAGENIEGRKISIRRLSALEDSEECNILFISSSRENQLRRILASAQHAGILTVSDIPHFAERGGIIGFVIQQDRIRFEVNRKAAEQSHLVLSSELLKVASKIIEKVPEGSTP
jgi:hypothetical protein